MVSMKLTTLILILLVLLNQSMGSSALNLQDKGLVKKKSIESGHKLKGRKMLATTTMVKTDKQEKPKSSEISGFLALHLSRKNQLHGSVFDQTSNKDKKTMANTVHENRPNGSSSYQDLDTEEHMRVSADLLTLMNRDYHFEHGKGRHNPPINNGLSNQVIKP